MVHVEYTKYPLTLTISEAFSNISSCNGGNSVSKDSVFRQRISNFFCKMPSPEHGASTKTRSNCSFQLSGKYRPSWSLVETIDIPNR